MHVEDMPSSNSPPFSKRNSYKRYQSCCSIQIASVKKLKNSVKQNKDPFLETSYDETSSFEDLYLTLLGLF